MEKLIEYVVPITGFFSKKPDPRYVKLLQEDSDTPIMVEDFHKARSFDSDFVRIGERFVFKKGHMPIIEKACIDRIEYVEFGPHANGNGKILLHFTDGTLGDLCIIWGEDPKGEVKAIREAVTCSHLLPFQA